MKKFVKYSTNNDAMRIANINGNHEITSAVKTGNVTVFTKHTLTMSGYVNKVNREK